MSARVDSVLFCRQAKRIPAHRMQDIKALHSLVSGDYIAGGITLGMPDVQAGRTGIGKHIKHVILGPGFVTINGSEYFMFFPEPLPFLFDLGELILSLPGAHLSFNLL